MEQLTHTGIPETIKHTVETLTAFYAKSLPQIREMSQKDFRASAHYGAGKFILHSWYLWWYEGHNNESWPKEKPALIKYFNDLGMINYDDMSSVLVASFYRGVHNRPLRIEEQVEHYKTYWRKAGFADGVRN